MSYIFIKNINNEGYKPTPILAISKEIETLNLADTYGNYGQVIGHYDAADYHFDNSASSAIKDCNFALVDAGLIVNVDEISFVDMGKDTFHVDDLYGANENCDKEKINEFVKTWRKENESLTEVKGFDYWDGHNWKTIITATEFGEPEYEIISEKSEEMNQAIEDCEFIEETHGKKYFQSEHYWIVESAWQGDFEDYQLFPKSDYEELSDIRGRY
ncbi:hypothetical protein [Polluticaenibacter yanchengensis]|uniref:Uncharacterized protein n=1 Tax=Polluticaenibacter yanchengensis TaxID=3014562 RepID=A0ABT4UJH8_9BACT|nr:hypothetical protein [Chitinophagaceae bacterium LY-5]